MKKHPLDRHPLGELVVVGVHWLLGPRLLGERDVTHGLGDAGPSLGSPSRSLTDIRLRFLKYSQCHGSRLVRHLKYTHNPGRGRLSRGGKAVTLFPPRLVLMAQSGLVFHASQVDPGNGTSRWAGREGGAMRVRVAYRRPSS